MGNGMDYLALQLFWYLLAAFGFGLIIGWFSCSSRNGRTQTSARVVPDR